MNVSNKNEKIMINLSDATRIVNIIDIQAGNSQLPVLLRAIYFSRRLFTLHGSWYLRSLTTNIHVEYSVTEVPFRVFKVFISAFNWYIGYLHVLPLDILIYIH